MDQHARGHSKALGLTFETIIIPSRRTLEKIELLGEQSFQLII